MDMLPDPRIVTAVALGLSLVLASVPAPSADPADAKDNHAMDAREENIRTRMSGPPGWRPPIADPGSLGKRSPRNPKKEGFASVPPSSRQSSTSTTGRTASSPSGGR